jgi:hypothetical protein
MSERHDLKPVKGINYDVGTEFGPGELSRTIWHLADVTRDLGVIRDELYCTSGNVYGTELSASRRLPRSQSLGLHVSFQPRSVDQDQLATTAFVEEAAVAAERLGRSGLVTLSVGCEITMFTSGLIPEKTFLRRMRNMVWVWLPSPREPEAQPLSLRAGRGSSWLVQERGYLRVWFREEVDWGPLDFFAAVPAPHRPGTRSDMASYGIVRFIEGVGAETSNGSKRELLHRRQPLRELAMDGRLPSRPIPVSGRVRLSLHP